jgi:hypothetical protein
MAGPVAAFIGHYGVDISTWVMRLSKVRCRLTSRAEGTIDKPSLVWHNPAYPQRQGGPGSAQTRPHPRAYDSVVDSDGVGLEGACRGGEVWR